MKGVGPASISLASSRLRAAGLGCAPLGRVHDVGVGGGSFFLYHCEGAPGPVPGESIAAQMSQAIWAALVQAHP